MKIRLFPSFIAASSVFIYIAGVSWFMSTASNIFGEQEDNFLMPLFVLLLFVISAAITGTLILGRPIALYLEGHKREAWLTLVGTLSFLILFATGLIIVLSMR